MASIKEMGNNKYRVFVSDGYDLKGQRRRVSKVVTASSLREAKKQAAVFESELIKGKVELSNNSTVRQLVDRWREFRTSEMADKTVVRYNGILDDFIIPAFGRKKVKEIQPLHIENYLEQLSHDGIRKDKKAGGYSPKTKKHHYGLLSTLFNQAVNWKVISESPCEFVKAPKVPKTNAKYYQIDEVKSLLECLEEAPMKYKVFVHLAVFSGCRRSELMGIEWKDLDNEEGTINLCRTSQYTKKRGIFTYDWLKDGEPSRMVTIPTGTIDLLKQYKAYQQRERVAYGEGWQDYDRLFTKEDGKPMHPDTPYQWFVEFLVKNDLPPITVHQLRHTNVSIMIYQGANIVTIAAEKGHNPYTMLGTYAHVIKEAYKEGATKMDEAFYQGLKSKTKATVANHC